MRKLGDGRLAAGEYCHTIRWRTLGWGGGSLGRIDKNSGNNLDNITKRTFYSKKFDFLLYILAKMWLTIEKDCMTIIKMTISMTVRNDPWTM